MAVSVSTVMNIHRIASRNRPLTVKVLLVFTALCLLGNFLPPYLNSKIITDKEAYAYKEYTYKGYDKVWEGSKKNGSEYIYIYTEELEKPVTVYTFCNDYVNLSVLANHKSGEKIQMYLEENIAPSFNHYAHEIVIEGDVALSFDEDVKAQKENNKWWAILFDVFAALSGACALVFYLEHKGVKVP